MISIVALGSRFNWRCHLCGKTVDRNLKVPHPGAPTRDHIIPKSRGGSDRISNIALAHSLCNQVRANNGLSPLDSKEVLERMQVSLAIVQARVLATSYDPNKLAKIRAPIRRRRRR